MNSKHCCYVFLLMSVCSQISAEEFDKYTDSKKYTVLQTQIDQQEFSQAWLIAQQQANEYLGDVHFDFLYGLAALNTGNVEVAVFAFERVVTNKPSWLDGQYYLALSYFKIANYQAVIPLCQTIINQPSATNKLKSLSLNLKQATQEKLAQQSLNIKHFFSASGGYDSNINAGINEDSVYLPSFRQNVELSEESKENSDYYATLNYRLNGSQALTQNSKLLFSGEANVHHFINKHDFNRINLNGSLSYLQQFEQFDASVGVNTQPLWLANDYYRNQTSVNAKIKKQLNQRWYISGTLTLGKTKNYANDNLDTDDKGLSVSNLYDVNNWRHGFTVSYLEATTDKYMSDHISKKSIAVGYHNIWIITPQWLASGALLWQNKKYQGLHPFYLTKQVDNMWLFSGMVQFQPSKTLSYRLNITTQKNNSNLSLFSYQRVDIGLTATMTF